MTLVEVLIVVTIIAAITGAIAVSAIEYSKRARLKLAQTGANTIRTAVAGYWAAEPSSNCPDVNALFTSGFLDPGASHEDPWGQPWTITCEGSLARVTSGGPDLERGTEDDIEAPKRRSSGP